MSSFKSLGLLLLLKGFLEQLAEVALALGAQRWINTVFLPIFRPSCMEKHKLCVSFLDVHLFIFEKKLRKISDDGIVFMSSVSAVNRSSFKLPPAFKALPMNFPGATFVSDWCG